VGRHESHVIKSGALGFIMMMMMMMIELIKCNPFHNLHFV